MARLFVGGIPRFAAFGGGIIGLGVLSLAGFGAFDLATATAPATYSYAIRSDSGERTLPVYDGDLLQFLPATSGNKIDLEFAGPANFSPCDSTYVPNTVYGRNNPCKIKKTYDQDMYLYTCHLNDGAGSPAAIADCLDPLLGPISASQGGTGFTLNSHKLAATYGVPLSTAATKPVKDGSKIAMAQLECAVNIPHLYTLKNKTADKQISLSIGDRLTWVNATGSGLFVGDTKNFTCEENSANPATTNLADTGCTIQSFVAATPTPTYSYTVRSCPTPTATTEYIDAK